MLRSRNLLFVLVATVAAACLSVPPAFSTRAGSSLQFSAVALGRENYFTPEQAQNVRLREDGVGVQGERIVDIWNGTSVPDDYDLAAACNAAQVSYGQKVLMFNLRPDKNSWPSNPASLSAYTNSLAAFDAKIFTGTGSNGQPCWPAASPPQRFMWMIGNEPNSNDFCNGDQSTNDLSAIHKVCAMREAMLLHSSYAFLQGEQSLYAKYLPDQRIYVVGGGLSSHDAPFDLLSDFLQARTRLGYKTCDMDYFGFHPYALNAANPYGGFAMEPKVESMLKAAGCPLKIIYTEMGIETTIPSGPGYSYNGKAPANILYTTEAQFLSVYQKFIQIIQGQPDVIGFMNFELDDEQDLSGWQSGFYYFSGYPKSFAADLKPLLGSIGNLQDNSTTSAVPPTR